MSQVTRILLIDDDESDYYITQNFFEEVAHDQYQLDWTNSYAEGINLIKQNIHDAYLVDFKLGHESGLDLINFATTKLKCKKPIILLTGYGGVAIDKAALNAGASDYIPKDSLTPCLIDRIVRYAIKHKAIEFELLERKQKAKFENQVKAEFIAHLSHEIRNPMTAILGNVQLLQSDTTLSLSQSQVIQVEGIAIAGRNLIDTLNDTLDVSKFESGAMKLNNENFDLTELLDGISQLYSSRCETKSLKWFFNSKLAKSYPIYSDKGKIRQTLVNLLGNAFKFTQTGKLTLRVEELNHKILFSVSDSGPGITEQERPLLYNRFAQGAAGIRDGGSGLGLYIVKKNSNYF